MGSLADMPLVFSVSCLLGSGPPLRRAVCRGMRTTGPEKSYGGGKGADIGSKGAAEALLLLLLALLLLVFQGSDSCKYLCNGSLLSLPLLFLTRRSGCSCSM